MNLTGEASLRSVDHISSTPGTEHSRKQGLKWPPLEEEEERPTERGVSIPETGTPESPVVLEEPLKVVR